MPDIRQKIKSIKESGKDSSKLVVRYEDGSVQLIPKSARQSNKNKWKPGSIVNVPDTELFKFDQTQHDEWAISMGWDAETPTPDSDKPAPDSDGGGGGGGRPDDYFNVKDYELKDALATEGYIHVEPGQDYIWSGEGVGEQAPTRNPSKWKWDDDSGFIRPSDITYGTGALEDFKRRHGDKIEQDYEGGWDAWVADLKDPKLGHTNDNKAVKWLVTEMNQRSQDLIGKDYVDVSKKGAYVPGVEIFNLPGIWQTQPEEEVVQTEEVVEQPCPDPVMFKDEQGNCNCPPGMTLNPNTGKCEGEAPLEDVYQEKDRPWLPDRLNVLGAMSDRIYRGEPHLEQIDLEPSSIALQTPDRAIAAEKEAQNKLVDFISQSTPMQAGLASAMGATADSLGRQANIIAQVEGANTDTMNRYGQYAADIENRQRQYNSAALKRFVDETNTMNQNLADEKDMKDANVLAATNRMLGNWYKKKWSEKVLFPQAYVDPDTGDPYWTGKGRDPLNPYDNYTPAYGGSGRNTMTAEEMSNQVQTLMEQGIDQDNATKMVLSQNQATYSRPGKGNTFGYDPYTAMDFSGGSGSNRNRRSKNGGNVPFGVFLQGGIFE